MGCSLDSLRQHLIRLARTQPKLRSSLIPLLRSVVAQKEAPDPTLTTLLSLFHHTHHKQDDGGELIHEVHHCGGEHAKVDPTVDYTIKHCPCGLHSINKIKATGHGTRRNLDLLTIPVTFTEKCPGGGWHIESGKVSQEHAAKLAREFAGGVTLPNRGGLG